MNILNEFHDKNQDINFESTNPLKSDGCQGRGKSETGNSAKNKRQNI